MRGTFVTKLTPETTANVTEAIRKGASVDTAASYAGIAKSTLRAWLAEGRAVLQRHEIGKIPEEHAAVAAFVFEVEHAMSECKLAALGRITADPSWQSDAWILERRFPNEFGRRQRIEHANPEGEAFRLQGLPMIDLSKLTDEEIDALIALHEKAAPDGARPSLGDVELRALPE